MLHYDQSRTASTRTNDISWTVDAQLARFDSMQASGSFEGHLRSDGTTGTCNEIWIVPTVGYVNQTARLLAEQANWFVRPSKAGRKTCKEADK